MTDRKKYEICYAGMLLLAIFALLSGFGSIFLYPAGVILYHLSFVFWAGSFGFGAGAVYFIIKWNDNFVEGEKSSGN